jgi:hypothetical protein
MDFQNAARQIVERTAYTIMTDTAALGDQAAAEAQAVAAIADSVGKSEASVKGIARALYWKLNPIGTVPVSYYDDTNFQKLTVALVRAAAGQSIDDPITERAEPEISADDLEAIDSMEGVSETVALLAEIGPREISKSFADNVAVEADTAIDEDAGTIIEDGDLASIALGSIRGVLLDFVGDLGSIFAIKPEWHGREAEAASAPAAAAAKRILDIWKANAGETIRSERAPDLTDEDVDAIVPKDWTISAAGEVYAKLEQEVATEWASTENRETAIAGTAQKIGRWIAGIISASKASVRDSNGQEIHIGFPKEWSAEVARQVLSKLLADDLKPFTPGFGVSTRGNLDAIMAKSVFENISPAVAFRFVADSVRPKVSEPVVETAEEPTATERREAWKMPWSVARRVVDDLCKRSSDETIFLSQFKDWLNLPAGSQEEIRSELVSEIVLAGREQPASDEEDIARGQTIRFVYENWKGEIEVRQAVPVRMTFGSNEWHKDPQWLLSAFDLKHSAMRTFAAKGIIKFLDGKDAS